MTDVKKQSILLVEDEALVAVAERHLLESVGYTVTVVSTGEQAVAMVPDSFRPDLILMDIDLGPGIDGTEAAERILEKHDVPTVFLSSHTEPEIVERTEGISSYGYIVKNSGKTVLLASIKMAFRLHAAHSALRESETSLRESQELALIGRWDYWHEQPSLNWSPMIYRIFELEESEFDPSYEAFLATIHPDDRAAVDTAWRESLENDQPYKVEHRLLLRDGRVKWVREHCHTVFGDAGAPVHSVGIVQDITERKTMELTLAEQKQYLETILETTSDGFWVVTPDKRLANVNIAYCQMSGYSKDELACMRINDIDAMESPQETNRRMKRIMQNGSETFETQHRRKDGSLLDVEVSASQFDRIDGMCLVCFCRDITERKKTQQELEKSQRRYQTLVERSPNIIYLFGTKSGGIFWSEATQRILGYEPQDIVRDPHLWNRSIHPDDKLLAKTAVEQAVKGEPFKIEYRIQSADGEWVWLRDRLIDRTEEDGEIIIQGHAEEITEEKNSKEVLENERRRLSAIIEGTNVGTWEWNVQTGETHFNERWAEIIGYTLEEISPISIETWKRFTHAEDLQRSEQLLLAHFRGETEAYETEIQMHHKNGRWVWVLDRGKVLTWTDDGRPEWVFGTHREITARKQLELKYLALAKAASTLQTFSPETLNYGDITETVQFLSGAACAVFNLAGPTEQTFTTQAIAGPREQIDRMSKLPGFPLVGTAWDWVPDREATLGEVARVRVTTAAKVQGEFVLFFSGGDQLQDQDIVETYSSMVGITLKRIQTEQHNTELVAEKETLLREAHHRIKNNMNTMTSLLTLHANTVEDASALAAIRDAESRFRSMQTLYDQLNLSGTHDQISLVAYLKTLVPQVVNLFPAGKQVSVSVTSLCDGCDAVLDHEGSVPHEPLISMDAKRLSTVGLIVNELLTNALKYAFPDTFFSTPHHANSPTITVTIDCADGDTVITVEDNGAGLPEDFDAEGSSGFGLTMINAMVGQLHGSLKYESDAAKGGHGTRVVLCFPSAGSTGR